MNFGKLDALSVLSLNVITTQKNMTRIAVQDAENHMKNLVIWDANIAMCDILIME